MKDLFLCHASEDNEHLVCPVADELRRRGMSVWLDEGQILPGTDFVEAIQYGMRNACAVVVFFSANFLRRRWPLNELNNCMAMGKPLIPIISDVAIENVLERCSLLSSTYMISKIQNPQEIARWIVRAYNFMRARSSDMGKDTFPQLSDSLETCCGTIRLPTDSSSVDRHILAEGDIISLPEIAWLWLVIEIGDLKWPKEPGVSVSGNAWTGEAYEGGTPPNGQFTLSLYVMGKAGFDQIKKWIDQGHRSGNYPGLSVIDNSRRLDSVNLRFR